MTDLYTFKRQLVGSLYSYEFHRGKYNLCTSKIGFFQPFKTPSDVQQQIKTTLVTPIIGLFSFAINIALLIKNLFIMAISIPCLSSDLFTEGLVDGVSALESTLVSPLVTTTVALASLLSLVTRTIATAFSFDGGEFNYNWLSFLPENPYKNSQSRLN